MRSLEQIKRVNEMAFRREVESFIKDVERWLSTDALEMVREDAPESFSRLLLLLEQVDQHRISFKKEVK